jgi:type II secretory pathway component PulF
MVVALLRAAEAAGGELGRSLLQLAERRRQEGKLRRRLVHALAYPAVVVGLTLAAAIVLQLRALPPMVENFKQLGATLPLPTRVLYEVSRLLIDHGAWLAAGGALLAAALARPARRLWRSESAQTLVLRTPLLGPVLRSYCLVRALSTFAMLKAAGAPTDQQFRHAAEAAANPVYRRFFEALHARVVDGEELHSACLAERDLIPGDDGVVIAAKLRIGAFSGESAPLLQALAADLGERADLRASLLPQAIEVPLLLLCGSIIAGIILAMLLPMPSLVIDMLKRPGGF